MTELIIIYEHGHRICTFTSTLLSDVAGPAPQSRTAELAGIYFEARSDHEGTARIELTTALDGNMLNAPKTEAFFLISAALKKSRSWNKLTYDTQMKFEPYLRAKTAAAKVRISRLEKIREFTRICRVATESADRNIITTEEALTRIVNALPPKKTIQLECESNPEIISVIRNIERYSRFSRDPKYSQIFRDYLAYIVMNNSSNRREDL